MGHYKIFFPQRNPDKPSEADLRHGASWSIPFSRQEIETEVPADSTMLRSRDRTSVHIREFTDAAAAIHSNPFPPFILKTPILWFQRCANPRTKAWFIDVYGGFNIRWNGINVFSALIEAPTQKKKRKDCNASRALRLHGGLGVKRVV